MPLTGVFATQSSDRPNPLGAVFFAAIDELAAVTRSLLSSPETNAPAKNRTEDAAKARARAAQWFAKETEV